MNSKRNHMNNMYNFIWDCRQNSKLFELFEEPCYYKPWNTEDMPSPSTSFSLRHHCPPAPVPLHACAGGFSAAALQEEEKTEKINKNQQLEPRKKQDSLFSFSNFKSNTLFYYFWKAQKGHDPSWAYLWHGKHQIAGGALAVLYTFYGRHSKSAENKTIGQ